MVAKTRGDNVNLGWIGWVVSGVEEQNFNLFFQPPPHHFFRQRGFCRSYESCSTFGNYYYCYALRSALLVSRWLLLLHAYMGPIRQSWAPQDSLAAHRSLHMSAEDDNYGGFGLPFAVLVVASWASINLALNFVRCPPTPNSAPLHVSDLVVPAAVQFIRVAP